MTSTVIIEISEQVHYPSQTGSSGASQCLVSYNLVTSGISIARYPRTSLTCSSSSSLDYSSSIITIQLSDEQSFILIPAVFPPLWVWIETKETGASEKDIEYGKFFQLWL